MAVVVMQPAAGQAPTAVSRVLAAAGLTSRTVPLADDAGPSADLAGVEGLIVLGAADPALLREALAAEVPVLALEPGTRLLVREADAAPGARTGTAPDRPPVELTRAAGSDPLFAGAARPSPYLRPACDPLELPADAVVLASCDGYPEQAFRIGASAWGVRFLPQELPLDPWGEKLLGRFATLVAARAEHTATRAFFTRRADAWEERFAYQTPAYEAAIARLPLAGASSTAFSRRGCSTTARTRPPPCANGPASPRPTASCCSSTRRAGRSAPPGTAAPSTPATSSPRATSAARWRPRAGSWRSTRTPPVTSWPVRCRAAEPVRPAQRRWIRSMPYQVETQAETQSRW